MAYYKLSDLHQKVIENADEQNLLFDKLKTARNELDKNSESNKRCKFFISLVFRIICSILIIIIISSSLLVLRLFLRLLQ